MLTVQIEADPYVGMLYLGRIQSGILRIGDTLHALNSEGVKVGEGKVKKIFGRRGLDRVEKDVAGAGEIVSIAGIKSGTSSNGSGVGVNVTLVHPDGWGAEGPKALPVNLIIIIDICICNLQLFRQHPSIHLPSLSMYTPMIHL